MVLVIRVVNDALKLHVLDSRVVVNQTLLLLTLFLQVVEVRTFTTSAAESAVVFEPVDASHDRVALALHVRWALSRIEVEDVNALVQPTCSEQVATVAESDLLA